MVCTDTCFADLNESHVLRSTRRHRSTDHEYQSEFSRTSADVNPSPDQTPCLPNVYPETKTRIFN